MDVNKNVVNVHQVHEHQFIMHIGLAQLFAQCGNPVRSKKRAVTEKQLQKDSEYVPWTHYLQPRLSCQLGSVYKMFISAYSWMDSVI